MVAGRPLLVVEACQKGGIVPQRIAKEQRPNRLNLDISYRKYRQKHRIAPVLDLDFVQRGHPLQGLNA